MKTLNLFAFIGALFCMSLNLAQAQSVGGTPAVGSLGSPTGATSTSTQTTTTTQQDSLSTAPLPTTNNGAYLTPTPTTTPGSFYPGSTVIINDSANPANQLTPTTLMDEQRRARNQREGNSNLPTSGTTNR